MPRPIRCCRCRRPKPPRLKPPSRRCPPMRWRPTPNRRNTRPRRTARMTTRPPTPLCRCRRPKAPRPRPRNNRCRMKPRASPTREPLNMGHKVNPIGLRLGINRTWDSRWFAGADYAKLLHEDLKLRDHLRTRLRGAGVSRVVIERPAKKPRVTIYAARPGVVIGKKGQDIEVLKKELGKMANAEVSLNIVEIRKPEIDATLIAENIAQQLERRVAFRRAMKRAVQSAMRLGAQGIRINCGGRLGGAEIARVEWYREGRVPLHTLRGDVDYGVATAKTTYGTCGVKVWVFKGEIMQHDPMAQDRRAAEQAPQR